MPTQRQRLNENWFDLFNTGSSYFLTLTFNYSGLTTRQAAYSAVSRFARNLDYGRLGNRFYERPVSQRTLFVLVPEKFDSYSHFHGAIKIPDDTNVRGGVADYPEYWDRNWKAIVPSGTTDFKPMISKGAISYSTKITSINNDDVLASFQFWSEKTKAA